MDTNKESSSLAAASRQNWTYTEEQQMFAFINNIVYYSLLFPVALLGNVANVTTVIKVLRVKKSKHYLLVGVLALADLMSLLTCHLLSVASMIKGSWIANDRWCDFQSMMSFTYLKIGFFTRIIMTLERFVAIAFPLHYRSMLTMKKILWLVGIIIVFSLVTSGMTLIFVPGSVVLLKTWPLCINNWEIPSTYYMVVVIMEGIVFFIGVAFSGVANVYVIRVILLLNKSRKKMGLVLSAGQKHKMGEIIQERMSFDKYLSEDKGGRDAPKETLSEENRKEISRILSQEVPPVTCYKRSTSVLSNSDRIVRETDSSGDENCITLKQPQQEGSSTWFGTVRTITDRARIDKAVQRFRNKEVKVAKFVVVNMAVFIALWIPYMIVIYYEQSRQESVHPLAEDIAIKLVFANAFIDPLLYLLFNTSLRNAYRYYIKSLCFYITFKRMNKPVESGTPWTL